MTGALIDAHVHVWSQDRLRYPFGPHDGLSAPNDGFTIDDLLADAVDAEPQAVLLIQPRVYGYDHAYLFDAAAALPGNVRVAPLVNVTRPHSTEDLRRLAAHERTAAFRVIALEGPPADWLCSQGAHHVWEAAAHLDLPVGMLVDPPQLRYVAHVAATHPGLSVIVDHLGRITPSLQLTFAPWLRDMAIHPNVYVKVSAVESLSQEPFPYTDMWALIAAAYDEFGASRLLWGSDWPHTRPGGSYGHSRAAVRLALAAAPRRDLDAIFTTTAARLFGFGSADIPGVNDGNP